ncbi:MAG: hypothetical protein RR359_02860 [Bacilli bacterium]
MKILEGLIVGNEWNYKSDIKQSNGYEDVEDILKSYKTEGFKCKSEDEQSRLIDEVFNIYRGKNIFPITYYNESGVLNEIKKCYDKQVPKIEDNVLDLKYNQGSSLCKFLFPNLHSVKCEGENSRTMYKKFYDDHLLKRAIKLCFSIKNGVTPSNVRSAMELIGGTVATNYKPMNAKSLYETYVKEDGVIYDFCGGFGGRMLGALSSENNYTYITTEPCLETYDGLLSLGQYIENIDNKKRFEIYNDCSEDFKYKEKSIDFAFSSPPYYNLEVYSSEPTQCYNKFKDIDSWVEGFIRPTVINIYNMLKDDGLLAVNIADFKFRGKVYKLVDKWIKVCEEEGFEFKEQVYMNLKTRRGVGHNTDITKREGIFIFSK